MSFTDYLAQRNDKIAVHYTCSCLRQRNVYELFVCTNEDCMRFVCDRCTQLVVDTYFCPSCLNAFFASIASKTKARCEQCVECPCCFHTLSTVMTPSGPNSAPTPTAATTSVAPPTAAAAAAAAAAAPGLYHF